jgi:preprotein translocase subunit YajC
MKPGVKVGLICGGVILTTLAIQALFLPVGMLNVFLTYIPFVVMLGGIYFAIKQQRTLQDGAIEFIAALQIGFKVAFICYLFYALGLYIGVHTVDTDKQIRDMLKAGKSFAEIKQDITAMKSEATIIWGALQFGLFPLIIGCLASLSSALLLSKKKSI